MDVHDDPLISGSLTRRHLLKLGGAAAGGIALGSVAGWPAVSGGRRAALAAPPANMYFERTWARTDKPVLDGNVSRTWMWGPEAFTGPMMEPYQESPGEEREVQYYDKARMEITNPAGDADSIWYVTNGLLVVELITGKLQAGHNSFQNRAAAQVNVAGDMDDENGPTYATFASLLDSAPLPLNSIVTQRVDRQANVTTEAGLADNGVIVGHIDDVTNHSIAAPFWEFMNSSGMVYQNGGLTQDKLFENPYFATGRPISEAYWADVKVAGTQRLVLVQCFERRCLTYTPGNPPGWLVEAGNVGLHYYAWRYEQQVELGEFCVPAPEEHKPKTAPSAKLQKLAESSHISSTLASAFFQMGRRYLNGHAPANALETAAFEAFATLTPEMRETLSCSLGKLDDLPPGLKDHLFNPMFPLNENPVTPELLANELAIEIVRRASLSMFGNSECMLEERPGLMRATPGLDGAIWYMPTITRINGLRTIQYGLPWDEYERNELQENCTIVPVDTNGDGIPDTANTVCPVVIGTPPCLGHTLDPVCMRVLEVRAGELVHLTGANYFSVGAKVRIMLGDMVRDVDAHVCGDIRTPLTENVDGVQRVIRDARVTDQITFTVPSDLASGVYTIQVIIQHDPGTGPVLEAGAYEYLRVVAPPTARFTIASEELHCINETSPASFGSDEVGLRIIAVPIELNGVLGEVMEHKFGGGSLGIFDDVDSGETRNIARTLISRSNIAGIALAVIGFEVDSESAYRDQVRGFIDAFIHVMKSSIQAVAATLAGAAAALAGALLGLSAALVSAIAGAIVAAIVLFVAIWAPADLIMEDIVGFSALDLDEMTSPNFQPRPDAEYTTAGAIDVKVEAISKIVDYLEHRTYHSDDEGSRYRISLRYSRT